MPTHRRRPSGQSEYLEDAIGRALRSAPRSAPPRAPAGIARRVGAVLVPVEPSQQFVSELGRSLMAMTVRSRQSLLRRYRTAILIGAAIFGSAASVVGVVALILRQRARGAPRAS